MYLTNRGIYNYFKERIVVHPHKSDEVIRKDFVTAEFMDDLEEPACDICMVGFPSFLKRVGGLLNSEALERQFWSADVYGGAAISINRNRGPCSRVRNDKNNDRKGNGQVGKVKGK